VRAVSRVRTFLTVVRSTVATVRRQQVSFLAAAIAYYAFVSLVPLALFGLAVGQYLGAARIEAFLAGSTVFLTPAAIDVIGTAVTDSSAAGTATVVGFVVLLWSGSRVFRGLDVAFSRVYGVHEPKSIPDTLLDMTIVLLGIPIALIVATLLGVVVPYVDWVPGSELLGPFGLVPALVVVFFPMYYRLPGVSVSVREALPGTVLAGVGWSLLATGFSVYATAVGGFQLYGVLGAALLLVTWLYLGGSIIMVGAVLNTVLAGTPADDRSDRADEDDERTGPAPDVAALGREVESLRKDLDAKTVSRSSLEAELKAYVRDRQRAGKATGWGPYLVLLYGTAMTLGAFYWLEGGWAILAMIVVWLSTLGLYVQLVVFGLGIQAASLPGRLLDRIRD
jgi:membrane protein